MEYNVNKIIESNIVWLKEKIERGMDEGSAIGMAGYFLEDDFGGTIYKTDGVYKKFFEEVRKAVPYYKFVPEFEFLDQGNGLDRMKLIYIWHKGELVWER